MQEATNRSLRIAIIGSGFSGLCLGIQLKRAGIDSFTIFEKSDRLGGTWRDNNYPGAACDIRSLVYCFSFEPKIDWTRKWSPQQEIQDYLEHCARSYGLLPHIRFTTEIAAARFAERNATWLLSSTTGEEFTYDVVVSAVGQLHRAAFPELPGFDRFRGEHFHSSNWNHAYDLTEKRVAVIGNAASAIQFIPQIAPKVRHLSIFQRSSNWILRRRDREVRADEKARLLRSPVLARLVRSALWLKFELMFPVLRRNRFAQAMMRRSALKHLEEEIDDPELRAMLVPEYLIGAKRLLISDDYYGALRRPNVSLLTSRIDHFTENSIVTCDGTAHPVDAVIFATGFQSTAFLSPMQIVGCNGSELATEWSEGARAYLGLTVPGFPNFFMMYGPNTNLAHNSIVFMIECQARYIVQAIALLREQGLAWIDVRRDVMESYNNRVQAKLCGSVWETVATSWYKNANGVITNNWPRTSIRYWWITRRFNSNDYDKQRTRPPAHGLDRESRDPAPRVRSFSKEAAIS